MNKREKIGAGLRRWGRFSIRFFFVLVGTVLVGTGCAYSPFTQVGTDPIDLSPANRGKQFSDIPSPDDANFHQERSFYYRGPGYRTAELIYGTEHTRRILTEFYRQQMKVAGWTLEKENDASSGAELVFTKKKEICRIDFRSGKRGPIIFVEIRRNPAAGS